MTVRRIDPNTGGIVTRGQHFTSGISEIAQTVSTRLRLFLGEYFRDVNEGTPWFEVILGKSASDTAREAAIKRRILQTDGVKQILQFNASFDPDTRNYSITVIVLTVYGQITVTEAV